MCYRILLITYAYYAHRTKHIIFSCLWFFLFLFIYFFFGCYHDNSWKAQPIQTKFSHMTFDWNSSSEFENGHRRSYITPLIGDFCPHWKFKYLRFSWKAKPTRTKFSHMTFDWNSSAKFENGRRRSHITPLIRGSPPPPWKLTYLCFQPIKTKFSHMTFDWNSSSEFENGHRSSNVTPPPPPLIGVSSPSPHGKFKYLRFWWNLNPMY